MGIRNACAARVYCIRGDRRTRGETESPCAAGTSPLRATTIGEGCGGPTGSICGSLPPIASVQAGDGGGRNGPTRDMFTGSDVLASRSVPLRDLPSLEGREFEAQLQPS